MNPTLEEIAGWLEEAANWLPMPGHVSAWEATFKQRAAAVRAMPSPEGLREALSFYADESRYFGPNQPLRQEADRWSAAAGLTAYRLDVTRDGGQIARRALAGKGE